MAEAFAETYRSIPWKGVYVSPMKRTIATAKPLCEALALEMQLRDGLKEIRYGKWEDKTVDFVKQHYWDDYIHWLAEPAWNPPTGGETSVEISTRALTVIAEIQQKYATGNVLVRTLWSGPTKVISEPGAIDIVGHRVVHGGREYEQSTIVTDEVKAAINRLSELAPAHNPANLEGIVAIERILGAVRQVAVFDTAFHAPMPEAAAVYPGPTNG